jgi:two-component system, NtrC family, sensor histidine kinase HydH
MGSVSRWRYLQHAVWIGLFLVTGLAGPVRGAEFSAILLFLGVLQVIEQESAYFASRQGAVLANLAKLLLGYAILAESGGISSSYYWILLIPVVSAATTLGVAGTVLFTVLGCATYLSFLLRIDWERYTIPADQISEVILRPILLAVIGYLTERLARANRTEASRAMAAVEQLELANRSLREAEAAVRRSERLAALGQLSAGLAHELRNPLGTMKVSAEMLLKNLDKEEMAKELAGFISSEVDRTNSLVTRFLEFARPLELQPQKAELSEVIDRAILQLERNTPRPELAIYRNYSPDVRPFAFDSELMERVVYNLLSNAAQATAPGGAITVKTRPVDGGVEMSVIDRGTGIAPQHLESIFNPFFTTKKEGVGLGLAIVSKIVDLHGGRMAVESELGRGSIFSVFLPLRATLDPAK